MYAQCHNSYKSYRNYNYLIISSRFVNYFFGFAKQTLQMWDACFLHFLITETS